MAERPDFIGDLGSQLADAAVRLRRRRRRGGRVVGVAAVGVVVMAGAAAFLNDGDSGELATTGGSGSTAPLSSVDGGDATRPFWSEAASAMGGEAQPGLFWTGEEVLVIRTENGGNEVGGERWDPARNEVQPVADSGLNWRVNPAMVWTGEEVLIVGGSSGPALDQIGAAYNPATDQWRDLADPPGDRDGWDGELLGPGVWTGSEMIVWRAGLAYDPIEDSWRRIAGWPLPEPTSPATVWTGAELVVWGGCDWVIPQCDEANVGLLSNGAMYDPARDRWEALPASPLDGAVHLVAGWTGSEVVIVVTDPGAGPETGPISGPGPTAAAFDPRTGSWRVLASPPLSPRRGAAGTWAQDRFVIWGGGDGTSDAGVNDGAAYDPVSDQWTGLPAGPGPGRSLHSMIDAGEWLYISNTRTGRPPLLLRLPSLPDASATEPPEEPLAPSGCAQPPTDQPGAVVGLPLADVWPRGFRPGFEPGKPMYAKVTDPILEGSWYVIGAAVNDTEGRSLGLAIWLMPDPIVAFAGSGEPGDPISEPESWHLYSFNDLAVQTSIWQPHGAELVEADPTAALEACGEPG